MAAYISFQPSDFFNTVLYTGTGATHSVTGVGFQPDFTWIKQRDGTYYHQLYDSVRGAGYHLASNDTAAQSALDTAGLSAWGADGFTVNTRAQSNYNTGTFASWNWKMGTTTGIDTTGSDITPTSYSFNQSTGQSIILYPGSGSDHLLPHGLGKAPQLAIIKAVNGTTYWMCYSAVTGNAKEFYLNGSNAAGSSTTWNTTTPTSVNISLDPGAGNGVNASGTNYVGYFFTSKQGCTKVGGYTGNGNADGPFVYTGFRPAYLILKRTDSGGDWFSWDNKRGPYNVNTPMLAPNAVTAETSTAIPDFLSNGFKLRDTNVDANASGGTYIYMAFAEFPFVSSNSKAGTAR